MEVLIETERLIIRPLASEDVMGMYKLDSDIRVQEFLGKKPIQSREEAAEVIAFIQKQYVDNGIGRWAVIEKETGDFIGWTGFKYMNNGVNGVEEYLDFGYRFIFDAWGKGYATEAGRACLQYASTQLTTYPIHAMSEVENDGSKRVLEKLGFEIKNTFNYQDVKHYWYIRVTKKTS